MTEVNSFLIMVELKCFENTLSYDHSKNLRNLYIIEIDRE